MKITHDLHVHTNLSVCAKETATPEHYLKMAKENGITKMGFANHFWDDVIPGANDFYKPQNYAHLCELKPHLELFRKEGIEVLFGCEGEYDPIRRDAAITPECAEQFDFIILPNSHTHMMMPKEFYNPYEKHAEFMIQAYEDMINGSISRYITAMAHPFEAVCCPYDNSILISMISDDRYKKLFHQTAEKGIAIEINLHAMVGKSYEEIAAMPRMRIFRLAKECGCKFTFGSDSHGDPKHHEFFHAETVADMLGLKENDLAPIAR